MEDNLCTQGHKIYQITQTRQLCGHAMLFTRLSSDLLGCSHHGYFSEEKFERYCLMCKACYELHVKQPRRKVKGITTMRVGQKLFQKYWKFSFLYIGRPWLIRKTRCDDQKWAKLWFRKIASDQKHPRVGESSFEDHSFCIFLHIHLFMCR